MIACAIPMMMGLLVVVGFVVGGLLPSIIRRIDAKTERIKHSDQDNHKS